MDDGRHVRDEDRTKAFRATFYLILVMALVRNRGAWGCSAALALRAALHGAVCPLDPRRARAAAEREARSAAIRARHR
ncbi:hypothetical protein [uncultured Jannaschia sp.]|uniref:hypothetical protein n=1 Tax=uncultured Jannaschia sp. TaxID=293347 RepID=UPI00260E684F|nr:hypothetical protein [uncultured Jannaschia sp.]